MLHFVVHLDHKTFYGLTLIEEIKQKICKTSKQINSADLANKVRHVEGGHDEDWEPLPQGVVPYFRLQPGEQTQSDAVGHSYGQHVGPDHTGHHVTM